MDKVSIIITTKRNFIQKIIDNYKRQSYNNKELIIIMNTFLIHKSLFEEKLKENAIDARIYQFDETITLGQCYNFGIQKMTGDFFCKMDDDDFYDTHYITNQLFILKKMNYDIIGKSYFYLYNSKDDILYSKYIHNIILGGTFIIKKNVFNKIYFDSKNRGEDTSLLNKAKKLGFKIGSSSLEDFVYIRYDVNHHTYNVDIKQILGNNYNIVDNQELKQKLVRFIHQ